MKFSRVFKTILLVSCSVFLNGCYILKQGSYLFRYTTSAKSTEEILKDSTTSSKTKQFIVLVNQIRSFSVDSLGLNKNTNYSRYVKVNRSHLVDVLSAAEELSFKQYKWCFPLFGCFPNKGFFEREDAKREAIKLADRGYDTIIDEVDAFSTLGILSDPLYSFMEEFSPFEIASLIIHEQTHATMFIKNKLQFNEELATYIGMQGALKFITCREVTDSARYFKIKDYLKDRDTYYELLRKLYRDLESVYSTNNDSSYIREQKKIKIDTFKSDISKKYDSLFLTRSYRSISKLPINNAFLAIRMTYTLDLGLLDSLNCSMGGNLKELVQYVKTLKKSDDPKKEIQKVIAHRSELKSN